MLRAQLNEHREFIDLCGFWEFRADGEDRGRASGWSGGFADGIPIAVPASWNDQLNHLRDFLGPAWYQTSFVLPPSWRGGRMLLRFGSVNYLAEVWLNDRSLGGHEGGHLPFGFDATAAVRPGRNLLVVRVDGELAPDRVPPGRVPPDPRDAFASSQFPDTSFDFFPFCGIQRPVNLCHVPAEGLEAIEVDTAIDGDAGIVRVRVRCAGPRGSRLGVRVTGHGAKVVADAGVDSERADVEVRVPRAALWAPGSPNLYSLEAVLERGGTAVDSFQVPIGIRTIAVDGDRLLLNGQPVHLRGFGRHEDFPVTGRGFVPALVVRDGELLSWTGANSFRTTHYPYSEEAMDLADRRGFLVIDETPAVGLFFSGPGLARRLDLCRRFLGELIDRDRNHPGVIAWSLANEPHSGRPEALAFFGDLIALAHRLDPSRPATMVSHLGSADQALPLCDIVCLNRYYGWYTEQGRIADGCDRLAAELDELHARHGKPIIVTEFGADAIPGCHAEPPEMFSEEYQAMFIERYLDVLERRPWVVGTHVWNLCDFKTAQAVQRPAGMNFKGVFTRDRRPKLAAHLLRRRWNGAS